MKPGTLVIGVIFGLFSLPPSVAGLTEALAELKRAGVTPCEL